MLCHSAVRSCGVSRSRHCCALCCGVMLPRVLRLRCCYVSCRCALPPGVLWGRRCCTSCRHALLPSVSRSRCCCVLCRGACHGVVRGCGMSAVTLLLHVVSWHGVVRCHARCVGRVAAACCGVTLPGVLQSRCCCASCHCALPPGVSRSCCCCMLCCGAGTWLWPCHGHIAAARRVMACCHPSRVVAQRGTVLCPVCWSRRCCASCCGVMLPGVLWSWCCCASCHCALPPGMLRGRCCCASCCCALLPGMSRSASLLHVVSWCVATRRVSWHGVAQCHAWCVGRVAAARHAVV